MEAMEAVWISYYGAMDYKQGAWIKAPVEIYWHKKRFYINFLNTDCLIKNSNPTKLYYTYVSSLF